MTLKCPPAHVSAVSGAPLWRRLRGWLTVDRPERLTYRSLVAYLGRAAPRYGVGPAVVVAYQVWVNGLAAVVLFGGVAVAALAATLSGFALRQGDRLYAGAGGLAVAAVLAGVAAALSGLGLAAWLVVFGAWFAVVAALAGYALAS
jgi:hypothetical protein